MPFCPNCKTEYVTGIRKCVDCEVDLVESLPEHNAVSYQSCPNCSGDVTLDSDFCPHCGVIIGEEKFFCAAHSDRGVEAVCIICNTLLCEECSRIKNHRAFCKEHEGVEVSEDWAVAFKSFDYYEANIVRGKLESAGISVTPRNNIGIGFLADGFLETPLARTILKYPVKVFVPINQYLDAVKVVNESWPVD
jgi:Double zinc ribbon